jgi:hypothetical protein
MFREKVQQCQLIESVDNITIYSLQLAEGKENIYLNPHLQTFPLPSDAAIETDALCVVETILPGGKHERRFLK